MSDVDPIPVPDPRTDWQTIWHFALSINGSEIHDGEELAGMEYAMRAMWDRSGVLPDDLLELRLVLFMLQRQHRSRAGILKATPTPTCGRSSPRSHRSAAVP